MSSAEAPCVKRRVVESADAVHFHVGTTRIRSRHAVHGSWTALPLAGPAPLRRRRRAEMLVGGHVRCDCERHGTLIENRSTVRDAQWARLQLFSLTDERRRHSGARKGSTKSRPRHPAHPFSEAGNALEPGRAKVLLRFTPHQTSRHGRARAEHGAGATLEVLEGANGRRSGFGVWTQHVHYITNRDGELAAHPKVK